MAEIDEMPYSEVIGWVAYMIEKNRQIEKATKKGRKR